MRVFKSTSLADQVFEKLENDIIQGVYPKGEILTELKLAEQLGVTRQTIGLIESGSYNPTLKLCVAICKALDKTLDELFWPEE